MTSGARAINSAAYLGTLPWSAAKRYSIRTLFPSRHPSSCSSCRNAATRCCTSGSSAGRFTSTPTRRIPPAGCCPPAASGHAAAAPPTSVMNSRRLMSNMGLPPPLRCTDAAGHDNQQAPAAPQSVCRTYSLAQNEAGSAGPPLRSRASKAPPRLPDRLTSAMGDLGEAVGPAAGFSNLRSLRHSSAALADPLRPSQLPRPSRRAARVRSGPPERPGNSLETSR